MKTNVCILIFVIMLISGCVAVRPDNEIPSRQPTGPTEVASQNTEVSMKTGKNGYKISMDGLRIGYDEVEKRADPVAPNIFIVKMPQDKQETAQKTVSDSGGADVLPDKKKELEAANEPPAAPPAQYPVYEEKPLPNIEDLLSRLPEDKPDEAMQCTLPGDEKPLTTPPK
jgi:hypothetical protein